MSNYLRFRLIAAAAFFAAMVFSGYYRARAERFGGKLPDRPEGLPPNWLRALLGLVLLSLLGLEIFAPQRVAWSLVELPEALRWFGAALAVAVVPLVWWTMRSIDVNVSQSISTRAGASLVTHGPYRWIRHPIYSLGFALLLGFTLLLESIPLALVLGWLLWWIPGRANREERNLIASFGDRYREYMRRTGRFFPRLIGGW